MYEEVNLPIRIISKNTIRGVGNLISVLKILIATIYIISKVAVFGHIYSRRQFVY